MTQTDQGLPILSRYSIEVTARDDEAFMAVSDLLPSGSEVFVADLPHQKPDVLVGACKRMRMAGFQPVPHLVARNIASGADLHNLLSALSGEASVDRALVLGGDRDQSAGPYEQALDLLRSGILQEHGIRSIAIACFPEGHPRIDDSSLRKALHAKLEAAAQAELPVLLVSQFAFSAQPILDYIEYLREEGISAPLRVGVAGPADRATLLKFGAELGAGESLQDLEEEAATKGLRAEESPEALLYALTSARAANPWPVLDGVHFFAFGSTARAIRWAQDHQG